MELPFEKTVCRYWKQKLYTLLNREETQELKLPDSMPDIGRVISGWGQVILRGKDWHSNGIGVSGGVMVWVLYAPEDGGALQRLESWIPFQIRADLPDIGEDGVIRVEPFLRGLDARAVSSRKLMLRAGIGLLTQVLGPDELELYRVGSMPDDVEQKLERYPFALTREAGEKSFLVDETLNLPSGMAIPEHLVYYKLTPEILEQKVLGSKAAFRGMGNLHLLYIDTDGRLAGTDFQVPFAQFTDLEGEYESDAQISNLLCVTSLELDLEESGVLHLKCGLVSQYMITSSETVELLEDCYSPCRDIELEKQLCSIPAWQDQQQKTVEFSSALASEGGSCVDLQFCPDAPDVSRRTGTVDVEMSGTFQGVMMNPDGEYTAVHNKDSASLHLDTECDTVCFPIQQSGVTSRREAAAWRTDTKVLLDLRSIRSDPIEMVTGVRMGEVKAPDPARPSVIIRCRKNQESLWDLAKRCGSTVGAIRRMNQLDGEPEEDKLLLIPVI